MKIKKVATGFSQFGFVIESLHLGHPCYWDGEGFWVSNRPWAKHYNSLATANLALSDMQEAA